MARNALLVSPPYSVERSLKRLGEDLRTARLRRNLTIAEVAAKIGTGPRAVMTAEQGKASTGIGIYAALLWAYDLLTPLADLADPQRDEQGLILAGAKAKRRARKSESLDRDF